jgi:hypothetical protein
MDEFEARATIRTPRILSTSVTAQMARHCRLTNTSTTTHKYLNFSASTGPLFIGSLQIQIACLILRAIPQNGTGRDVRAPFRSASSLFPMLLVGPPAKVLPLADLYPPALETVVVDCYNHQETVIEVFSAGAPLLSSLDIYPASPRSCKSP